MIRVRSTNIVKILQTLQYNITTNKEVLTAQAIGTNSVLITKIQVKKQKKSYKNKQTIDFLIKFEIYKNINNLRTNFEKSSSI